MFFYDVFSFFNLDIVMWTQNSVFIIITWLLVFYIAAHYAVSGTDVRDLEKHRSGMTSIDTCFVDDDGSEVTGTKCIDLTILWTLLLHIS